VKRTEKNTGSRGKPERNEITMAVTKKEKPRWGGKNERRKRRLQKLQPDAL